MKADRLRQELVGLESIQAPDLLPEIDQRIDTGSAELPWGAPRPRTPVGRAILGLGVILGVAAGWLLLTRALPFDSSDAGNRQAATIPGNAIIVAVADNELAHLYVVDPGGAGYYEVRQDGAPVTVDGHSAAISPDGTRIAYVQEGADEQGVWVLPLDGMREVRLSEAVQNGDKSPAWSPDGRTIVFSRNRTGHGELFAVEADGSNLTQITSNEIGQDLQPAWSPDGASIVFVRNSGGPIDLWITDALGHDVRQLTEFEGHLAGAPSYPAWSPDGTRVVFAAAPLRPGNPDDGFEPRDLWVINADGTNLTQLTVSPEDEIAPRWSPDGDSIVFLSATSQERTGVDFRRPYALTILDLTSGEMRRLEMPLASPLDLSFQWLR